VSSFKMLCSHGAGMNLALGVGVRFYERRR
jgi:hypothetical protein